MSTFSLRQVGDLIVGNAVATETTVNAFRTSASNGEIKAFSDHGGAVAAGQPFKVYQKAANSSDGVEFTDVVDPKQIEKITLATYAAETQKSVRVNNFTYAANTTYVVEIRILEEGGTLSPENFATIQGFYTTTSATVADTVIRDGVLASLQANLDSRGGTELTLASVTGPVGLTITGQYQDNVIGKIDGRQIEFEVIAKSFSNQFNVNEISQNTGLMAVVTSATNNPGNGTGKYATNYEWFIRGYKYDATRLMGYPADFPTPYYTSKSGIYNVIHVIHYSARKETSVERQYKVLTILVDKGTDTLANNAATNAILGQIRTAASGFVTVPADLAVE